MGLNKEELYNKCLDEVTKRINQYNDKLETISGENLEKDYPPGSDQFGNKGEMMTEYEKNASYLDRVQTMKEVLANLDHTHRSEIVRPGSVVETKNSYYFISVPLGEIEMDSGRIVYAISTEAPIYKHLEGKKAGDKFTFNDSDVEIVQVL